jgi:hypothetical protein
MSQPRGNIQRRRAGSAEDRAWEGFYRRIADPAIAKEILVEFEADPDMKRMNLGLYLCCKESVRKDKAKRLRNERIGQFVRAACRVLFVAPFMFVQRMGRDSRDIAVECLPEVTRAPVVREPAIAQVRKLIKDPEFAAALSEFNQDQTQNSSPKKRRTNAATVSPVKTA